MMLANMCKLLHEYVNTKSMANLCITKTKVLVNNYKLFVRYATHKLHTSALDVRIH